MTYEDLVPVKTWLPASTYRAWARKARELDTDVGTLLAQKASASVKRPSTPPPAEPQRRTWVRMTEERMDYARQLAELGYSQREIAKTIGVSYSSMSNHWHQIIRGMEQTA